MRKCSRITSAGVFSCFLYRCVKRIDEDLSASELDDVQAGSQDERITRVAKEYKATRPRRLGSTEELPTITRVSRLSGILVLLYHGSFPFSTSSWGPLLFSETSMLCIGKAQKKKQKSKASKLQKSEIELEGARRVGLCFVLS